MNECILVVDDDREIVGAIAIVLEREGVYRPQGIRWVGGGGAGA